MSLHGMRALRSADTDADAKALRNACNRFELGARAQRHRLCSLASVHADRSSRVSFVLSNHAMPVLFIISCRGAGAGGKSLPVYVYGAPAFGVSLSGTIPVPCFGSASHLLCSGGGLVFIGILLHFTTARL
jgi:hypothetical protein